MTSLIIPQDPLISVVMPVRNAERYVAEAIRSVQSQTYPRWELIVVDSSSDGTPGVVEELARADSRIRMVHEPPGSIARASNVGVDLARGELVARMDADDIALPDRLAVQLDWMLRTGVEVCGAWSKWFGDSTDVMWFPEHHRDIANRLLFGYALLQPTLLTHAEILRRHRYSEEATFEGFELFTRLALHHRLGSVPAILLRSRSHADQVHIVESEACLADVARCRRPLFAQLYPWASDADYEAVEAAAELRPLADRGGLERVGEWLARFAQTPDAAHRRWLLGRWRRACGQSAALGFGAYRAYARFASRLDAGHPSDPRLAAACALRAPFGSRRHRILAKLRPGRMFPARDVVTMRSESLGQAPPDGKPSVSPVTTK